MSKLAVIIPGIGYTVDKPLLYYGIKIAQKYNYDEIVKVSFSPVSKKNLQKNNEAMKEVFEAIFREAEKQLEDIDFNSYDDVLFIAKSIGTIVATAFSEKHNLKARHVLYTPLEQTFEFKVNDAVAFIGTSDPWSEVDKVIKKAEESGVLIGVYEGCNHSLESEDIARNIEILKEVMGKSDEFIKKED